MFLTFLWTEQMFTLNLEKILLLFIIILFWYVPIFFFKAIIKGFIFMFDDLVLIIKCWNLINLFLSLLYF